MRAPVPSGPALRSMRSDSPATGSIPFDARPTQPPQKPMTRKHRRTCDRIGSWLHAASSRGAQQVRECLKRTQGCCAARVSGGGLGVQLSVAM